MATSIVAYALKAVLTASVLVTILLPLSAADPASTIPIDNPPPWLADSQMWIVVSPLSRNPAFSLYKVFPLTGPAGQNATKVERAAYLIQGSFVVVDEENYNKITAEQIAYLSCDKTSGNVSTDEILNGVMARQPTSIVLYSKQEQCCELDGKQLTYSSIYTTNGIDDTVDLNLAANADQLTATIRGDSFISSNRNDDDVASNRPLGGSSFSPVAIILVYSILGPITLLFIVVFIGVLRGRRFPQLYGPRPAIGPYPRQSRVMGTARAVLDMLPIIKFGGGQPQKVNAAGDIERGTGLKAQVQASLPTIREEEEEEGEQQLQPHQRAQQQQAQPHKEQGKLLAAEAVRGEMIPLETPAGMGVGAPAAGPPEDVNCSICKEDFRVGEDLRVLPCDHKFHPPCVDPWLINVSGTCPLCRLNPSSALEQEVELTLPLEKDVAAATA